MAVKDYIRERFFPHIWCAGCGHGIGNVTAPNLEIAGNIITVPCQEVTYVGILEFGRDHGLAEVVFQVRREVLGARDIAVGLHEQALPG